jgi:adenine phosphoribosyltransferase
MIAQLIDDKIRDVPDFPSEGIVFKDITPLLQDVEVRQLILHSFVDQIKPLEVEVLVGVESRGFLFGMLLANELKIPFVPIRKKGKLPGDVISQVYDLEYGSGVLEIQNESIAKGQRVLVHDDLLATGGTAVASAQLISRLEAEVVAFAFVVELQFLNGKQLLNQYSKKTISLVSY